MTVANASAPLREVLLIDLSGIWWSGWHATGNEAISEAKSITLANVRRCIGDGNRLVAICCDSGRSFRKDLSPEYKAQRPEKDHASLGELERVKERLRLDGLLLWEAPGFEADDIIATATQAAWGIGHFVTIASADKDLLQLVGPEVRCLRTHTWQNVGETEVRDTLGVRPIQVSELLALTGDKSDNIKGASGTKGAPGIGPKTAAELLALFGNVDGIYAAVDAADPRITTPIAAKLRAAKDSVYLARKLVTLRTDAPIKFEDIYAERKPQPLAKAERGDMDMDDGPNLSPGPGTTKQAELELAKLNAAKQTAAAEVSKPAEKSPAQQEEETQKEYTIEAPRQANGHATAPIETALAIYQPFERGLEPTTLGTAMKLAQSLYDSRLYERFKSAEAIHAVIIRGREMGLGALTALDCFHVIEGKPSPWAWLMISRAMEHPDCEYLYEVESSAISATWETKNRRNPKPQRLTYTFAEAQAAKLVKPGSAWEKNPSDMVTKTAGLKISRRVYPGAFIGLTAIEELGGE